MRAKCSAHAKDFSTAGFGACRSRSAAGGGACGATDDRRIKAARADTQACGPARRLYAACSARECLRNTAGPIAGLNENLSSLLSDRRQSCRENPLEA